MWPSTAILRLKGGGFVGSVGVASTSSVVDVDGESDATALAFLRGGALGSGGDGGWTNGRVVGDVPREMGRRLVHQCVCVCVWVQF